VTFSNVHSEGRLQSATKMTKGISVQSRKLAFDNYGQCVMLPMATGVNSLNSSIAGSILLYEIHRQYSEKVDTGSCEQVVSTV
jgi:hypothetical protein